MPSMVQVRNVPTELHRRLKARAAMEGLSMSDYILRELRKALDRPTREEVLERLRSAPPGRLRPSAADVIRHERNSR
jgi:plasmid stability protein